LGAQALTLHINILNLESDIKALGWVDFSSWTFNHIKLYKLMLGGYLENMDITPKYFFDICQISFMWYLGWYPNHQIS